MNLIVGSIGPDGPDRWAKVELEDSSDEGGDDPSAPAAERPRRSTRRISRKLSVTSIEQAELLAAKQAFSTRRVDLSQIHTLVSGPLRPRTGDLVLCEVVRVLYQRRIELPNGRKAAINPGDRIIVAYGDRYATDQFEAEVPLDLGKTNLVATGGVAAKMLSRTSGLRGATEILPLGLLGDANGSPLNLKHFALPKRDLCENLPPVFAVLGTSMNSGKTTTNQAIAVGLSRAGYRVGTAKVTGTGSGGDYWSMVDSGATCVVDFTDAGYSATYKLSLPCLEEIMRDLVHHLANERMDVILIEVADGILQEQNVDFILSPVFQDLVDGIFFAAGEAMGAALGVNRLMALGLPLVGVSGKLTASELLIREAQHAFEVPVYRKEQLADPVLIGEILQLNEHNRIQAGADSIFAFPDTPVHQEALVEMRSIA